MSAVKIAINAEQCYQKGKEINLTELVATIGAIIDGICNKEIDALLTSKQIIGSINKIKTLLDEKGINYDPNTIDTLRALHHIRNKMFPVHEGGSAMIPYLQKLNVDFPIHNSKDAASKMLQNLNSCLLEMKKWFR